MAHVQAAGPEPMITSRSTADSVGSGIAGSILGASPARFTRQRAGDGEAYRTWRSCADFAGGHIVAASIQQPQKGGVYSSRSLDRYQGQRAEFAPRSRP